MTYAAELDDRRQEVRRGQSSATLVYWPKVLGTGNVAAATSPAPSFVVYSPAGLQLASGTPTATTVDAVTKYTCTVDVSNLTTYYLLENYACVITWYEQTTSVEHVVTVRFDVVTEPYDGSDVSLNDLQDEVADVGELILAQAHVQVATRTAEQHAALVASKAWQDIRRTIKAGLEAKGRIYPRLILDREGIRWVIVAQAISRIYRAQGGGMDSPSRALAEDWAKEATLRLKSLGEMAYDADEDRVEDTAIAGPNVVTVGRSWA